MSVVVKKVGNFQKTPKINVIVGGEKIENILFEALGFDFIKTNDNLKIVCYEAYEENQNWGGGFLYGHALAEVEIKIPVAIQNLNEEILEKLRQDDEFKESFAKLNMDKKPSIGDDGLIFAVFANILCDNKNKIFNFNIDEMFDLIIKHLSK